MKGSKAEEYAGRWKDYIPVHGRVSVLLGRQYGIIGIPSALDMHRDAALDHHPHKESQGESYPPPV